jgi:hypothetical protein
MPDKNYVKTLEFILVVGVFYIIGKYTAIGASIASLFGKVSILFIVVIGGGLLLAFGGAIIKGFLDFFQD